MKKSIIITLIILIILLITVFFLATPILTGKSIQEKQEIYTYTKAICNESNYCQDNIIKCENNQTISITPITGAAVQFHKKDFKDPRNQETIEKFC
jgi:hypothetical protein